MKRLGSLLLVLIGIAYPFVVYFGSGHLNGPVLGAVLGALWLVRAPQLLRQPGGRWMVGAALLYCAALMLVGGEGLMRWYPTLVSALLLVAFALSLRYGPPVIERIARLMEPDLPPEGVRYTRQVTQIWIGFFAFNGLLSAALTLWAPLHWWTLYNGLIAYLLMGALLAGEWLVRRRVREAASEHT